MYEPRDTPDGGAEAALRLGLRSIPTPALSPDFDARVLAQIHTVTFWERLREIAQSLRPAAGAAAITAPLGLAILAFVGQTSPEPAAARSVPAVSAQALPVDQALDRPDLSAATLRRLSREESAVHGRSGATKHSRAA